jgi:urea transport system substrate-binding protein
MSFNCEVKMKRRSRALGTVAALAALICTAGAHGSRALADEVKVGVLHSLTGTMAISEVTVKNATMLAIDQINAAGGVNGS